MERHPFCFGLNFNAVCEIHKRHKSNKKPLIHYE